MKIAAEQSDAAMLEELGRRLRQTRLERNISQASLAKEAGVGRVTLQRIEDGGSPSLLNLIRVLRALDLADGIDRLVPEPVPSPIDQLRRKGQARQRAGSPHRSTESGPSSDSPGWQWQDEEDGNRG